MKFFGRKRRFPARRKRTYKKRASSALTVARKALSLARKTKQATVVEKYFTRVFDQDLAQTAIATDLTSISNYTQIFCPAGSSTNNSGIVGNSFRIKSFKLFFDIHMDNLNSEEETCNYTIAVVRPTKQFDEAISGGIVGQGFWYNTAAGQVVFDKRYLQVVRQKYFSLTMGGTTPGTSGESRKYFTWNIPVNRMVTKINSRMLAGDNWTTPANVQDRYYLIVVTDNSTADTENPRGNITSFMTIEDQDQQIGTN